MPGASGIPETTTAPGEVPARATSSSVPPPPAPVADDRHLERAGGQRLGDRQGAPGEAGVLVRDGAAGVEGRRGGQAVALGPGEGGEGEQRAGECRHPRRLGVVGAPGRPGEERRGVVRGVVHGAVGVDEPLEGPVEQRAGGRRPAGLPRSPGAARAGRRRGRRGRRARPERRPTRPSREVRRSIPSTSCASRTNVAAASAAVTRSGRWRATPASASAATARPFHAVTTLSSRPGWGRPSRAARSRRPRRPPPVRVVGLLAQLQGRGPVLERPLGGDAEQPRGPRAVVGAEHLGELVGGPRVGEALVRVAVDDGVGVERRGEGALGRCAGRAAGSRRSGPPPDGARSSPVARHRAV